MDLTLLEEHWEKPPQPHPPPNDLKRAFHFWVPWDQPPQIEPKGAKTEPKKRVSRGDVQQIKQDQVEMRPTADDQQNPNG